jgi:parvulin-like peptidyl-prolyl cis-trans isomerase-like protein
MLRGCGSRLVVMMAALWLAGPRSAWSQPPTPQSEAKPSNPGDRVVLTIGEKKFTAAQVEQIIEALPRESRAFYGGQGKKFLPTYLVQMAVLSDEAKKHNLHVDTQVQQAIENATEAILANAERERIERSFAVDERQLQEAYQQHKTDYEEVRIRHILIRTASSPVAYPGSPSRPPLPEAEARAKLEDLRKQILAGADFAQLAQKNSDDLTTAASGGDMGYINRQQVVPPIVDAAHALAPGQVSDIIQTPYGLELVKVEDRHEKPFSEIRQGLEAEIRKTQADQVIHKLIGESKVVVDNQYFSSNPQSHASGSPVLH